MTSEQERAESTLQQKEKPNPGEETTPHGPERPYDPAEWHLHEYFEKTWSIQAPRSHRIGRQIYLSFQMGGLADCGDGEAIKLALVIYKIAEMAQNRAYSVGCGGGIRGLNNRAAWQ